MVDADPPVLERWLALEMARFHRAFVPQPRVLGDLLREDAPGAPTRGGELHRYDVDTLRRIGEALSPLARRQVRLPATFFVDKDLSDDVHLADGAAIDMLRALRELPEGTVPREGKLWLGHSRARLIAQRYPSAFQFVYY